MMFQTLTGALVLAAGAFASPAPNKAEVLQPRQTITPGGKPCGQNGPDNRGCWKNNWRVTTDYEKDVPPAFVSDLCRFRDGLSNTSLRTPGSTICTSPM